jgi:AhpD family alkylhydroperoxidase
MPQKVPSTYSALQESQPELIRAVEALGQTVHQIGPLDAKQAHLIQLAAAAAIRSEGAVHSHARRAQDAGASPQEIRHALMLLTSTIGFPQVVAALSWVEDLLPSAPRKSPRATRR